MEQKFTPISLLSFKTILENHFDEFKQMRVWGANTKIFSIHRDSNLPVALAFNDWPKVNVLVFDEFDIKDEKLIAKITLNNKNYIAVIKDFNEIKKEITFSSSIYRSEKREEERLICYPHRSIYLYTNCPELEENNVLTFGSKNTEENIKVLQIRNKFIKRSDKLEPGDLIGLRVFDLSSEGMSVVVSKEEMDMMENHLSEMIFKLKYFGEYISLKNLKLIHHTHLILPEIRDSKLFKLGISFDYQETIFNQNQDLIDSAITLEELEKDYLS